MLARMRRVLVTVTSSFTGALFAVACGAFGADGSDGSAVVEETAAPDVNADAFDGEAPDGPNVGDLPATCPTSRAPSCAVPNACPSRPLRSSKPGVFPFNLVTDRTHVYWVEQEQLDGGDDAYNGQAAARIMRVPKKGGSTDVLAAAEAKATTVVLDGEFVYWATSDPTNLRRVPRACVPPCPPPESIYLGPGGTKIVALARPASGRVVALRENGDVVLLDVSTSPPSLRSTPSNVSTYVTMAVTNDAVHVAGANTGLVRSIRIADLQTTSTSIAPIDGGSSGFSPMTTDCDALWANRGPSSTLYKAVPGGSVTPFQTLPVGLVFGLRADAKYVYAALPNAGGVFAVDKVTKEITRISPGNVFALAVDDDGVYWGEHDRNTGGAVMIWEKSSQP